MSATAALSRPGAMLPIPGHLAGQRALSEAIGYRLAMSQLQKLLIAVLALYCCFMVFKASASAGFFLLPLLLVLPPFIFKSRKKVSGDEEE